MSKTIPLTALLFFTVVLSGLIVSSIDDPCQGYKVNDGGMKRVKYECGNIISEARVWNDAGQDVFIPTKTASEFNALENYASTNSDITVKECEYVSKYRDDICCNEDDDLISWSVSGTTATLHCCPEKATNSCYTRSNCNGNACCDSEDSFVGWWYPDNDNKDCATIKCCE